MVVDVENLGIKDRESSFKPGVYKDGDFSEDLLVKAEPAGLVKPKKNGDIGSEEDHGDFKCVFTKDPRLLLDYFRIREEGYREYLGLSHFDGDLDDVDLRSHICLLLNGKKCIGGVRITVHEPILEEDLPCEEDKFKLQELFPEYDLRKHKFAECSRLALDKGYRSGVCAEILLKGLIERCRLLKTKYVFAFTPLLQARRYQRIYTSAGLDFKIKTDLGIPYKSVYNGIRIGNICLCVAILPDV